MPEFAPLDQIIKKGDSLNEEEKDRYAQLWPLVAKK